MTFRVSASTTSTVPNLAIARTLPSGETAIAPTGFAFNFAELIFGTLSVFEIGSSPAGPRAPVSIQVFRRATSSEVSGSFSSGGIFGFGPLTIRNSRLDFRSPGCTEGPRFPPFLRSVNDSSESSPSRSSPLWQAVQCLRKSGAICFE